VSVVDEVKDRIDIVDFISNYVQLKKAGRTYKGICPFHAEKTPSFVVFPDTQSWHCFGACGTGGDVFAFLMRHDGLDFSEALRQLAERAGVLLAPPTPEAEESDKKRDTLREMHAAAAQYFNHLLRTAPAAQAVRDYVANRALSPDTVEKFQLGYALESWDGLKKYLLQRGFTEEDMLIGGLLVKKEESGSTYDRFRNRLIIPIRDRQGHVIAFGARALHPNDVPKYLNSPQTPLFDKSGTLYGLDMAKRAIRDLDQAILVEGYMDVLSAHQHGVENVVAGMGTALTETQLRQLHRLTQHLVLALDADTAGSAATLRGIDTARQALDRTPQPIITSKGLIKIESRLNVDIRIASLPPGRDPDDIFRQTPDEWPQIIAGALPVVSFYMRTAAAQFDLNTAKGKSALVRQVMPLLREIDDAVEQSHYIAQLAQLVHVEERVLLADLQQESGQPHTRTSNPQPAESAPTSQDSFTFGAEEHLLTVILTQPGALTPANAVLQQHDLPGVATEDFSNSLAQALFPLIAEWVSSGDDITHLVSRVEQIDPVLLSWLQFLQHKAASMPAIPDNLAPEEIISRVLHLRNRTLQTKIGKLRFLQAEAANEGDRDEMRRYQQLVNETTVELRAVERAIYDRSHLGRRRNEAIREGLSH
jgi:DNA primase